MTNYKKRPLTRSQGRDLFYQTVTDCSVEETQGIFEFMKKLKQADDDQIIFHEFCRAIKCYRSGSLAYTDLKNVLLSILRDHQGLHSQFLELVLGFIVRNHEKKKSDVERTDSKDVVTSEECVKVKPTYRIRPEAEEGSSSNGVASQKRHKSQRCVNEHMNNLEDELMKEDMLMRDLAAVIRFAKDALIEPKLFEKPPLGFNRVMDWFWSGKEVPQEYKTHPNRAAIYMLPMLQYKHDEMTMAKTSRAISLYNSLRQ